MKITINSLLMFLTLLLLCNCGGKSNEPKQTSPGTNSSPQQEDPPGTEEPEPMPEIVYSEDKGHLAAYYEIPHIKEFYEWVELTYSPPEEVDYTEDLSALTYEELRLLRNEVFARNGYLFSDGFLRGYFNQFDWYMPIFNVPSFKVSLNEKEQKLIDEILAEEIKRKEKPTKNVDGLQLLNTDLMANSNQFEFIPAAMREDLDKQNFSILDADRALPFYTYDLNAYSYIPHYITTDIYLYILHKYFSSSLRKLEENHMYEQLRDILRQTFEKLAGISEPGMQASKEWAQMYCAIALSTIGDGNTSPPESFREMFEIEKRNIQNTEGKPVFIQDPFVHYSELKPRGHYTKSDTLKKYFKAFKWISLNGINIDTVEELKGMMLMAHIIKSDNLLYRQYKNFMGIVEKLAGKEDNISFADMVEFVNDKSPVEALSSENVDQARQKLRGLNKEKIKRVFGPRLQTPETEAKRLYFLSSTYSLSGDIFSNLVHVNMEKSKRPFPKGLDVPAVFGNQTAQNIIVNEYEDHKKWTKYLPRLDSLKGVFKDFDNWDSNYGFKGVQTALSACAEQENYPDFMKTDAYNRKELSTTLSSWTHIKHDLILYQEKPFAAEAGQGGGPEPPRHYSYVEPNLKFWNSALELVEWLEQFSNFESTYKSELGDIRRLGVLLRDVARKQVQGRPVSREEFEELHYVGGTIEYILLGLLESAYIPDREKSMALIADVYVYNGENLNVAVGHADDIHVVVPINGEYYIARGAVFSYYEFVGEILNDEQWQQKIKSKKAPDRPQWILPIINPGPELEGQVEFRY